MSLTTSDLGECELLDKMLKDSLTTDEGYTLRLYSNNYTPLSSSVAADFTTASFTNYADKSLTRAGFNAASVVSNKASSSYGTTQSWTCGATGQTIYGYVILGATSGTVLWAEKFATARTLADGDILNLDIVVTLNSEA